MIELKSKYSNTLEDIVLIYRRELVALLQDWSAKCIEDSTIPVETFVKNNLQAEFPKFIEIERCRLQQLIEPNPSYVHPELESQLIKLIEDELKHIQLIKNMPFFLKFVAQTLQQIDQEKKVFNQMLEINDIKIFILKPLLSVYKKSKKNLIYNLKVLLRQLQQDKKVKSIYELVAQDVQKENVNANKQLILLSQINSIEDFMAILSVIIQQQKDLAQQQNAFIKELQEQEDFIKQLHEPKDLVQQQKDLIKELNEQKFLIIRQQHHAMRELYEQKDLIIQQQEDFITQLQVQRVQNVIDHHKNLTQHQEDFIKQLQKHKDLIKQIEEQSDLIQQLQQQQALIERQEDFIKQLPQQKGLTQQQEDFIKPLQKQEDFIKQLQKQKDLITNSFIITNNQLQDPIKMLLKDSKFSLMDESTRQRYIEDHYPLTIEKVADYFRRMQNTSHEKHQNDLMQLFYQSQAVIVSANELCEKINNIDQLSQNLQINEDMRDTFISIIKQHKQCFIEKIMQFKCDNDMNVFEQQLGFIVEKYALYKGNFKICDQSILETKFKSKIDQFDDNTTKLLFKQLLQNNMKYIIEIKKYILKYKEKRHDAASLYINTYNSGEQQTSIK